MEPAAVLRILMTAQGVRETQVQLARVQAEAKRTADSSGKLEKQFGSLNARTIGFNQSMMKLRNVVSIMKWPAMIAGAGQAAGALGALGTSAGAVTAALGPLTGAMAGVAGLYSAVGQAAIVTRLGLSGISEALGGNKKALDRLTPAQREFVKQLQGMKEQVKSLQNTVASNMLPRFGQALRMIVPLVNRLRPAIAATARTMGELAVAAAQMLVSMGPSLQRVAGANVGIIRNLGMAVVALARALITVLDVARPLTTWMSQMIRQGAEWTAQQLNAARASGRLANFLAQTQVVMTTLGRIAANLAVGLYNIAKAAVPLGDDLLRSFTDLTARFREWTESATGQNAIAKYFRDARAPAYQVMGLLGDIVKALAPVFRPTNLTTGVIADLRKLVAVLGSVLQTTTRTLGPALITTLTNLARILASVAGTSGPLTLLFKAIAAVTGVIADLVQQAPGLSTVASFTLGLGSAYKLLAFVAAPLAGLFGTLETALFGQAAAAQTAKNYTVAQRIQLVALRIQEVATTIATRAAAAAQWLWGGATKAAAAATALFNGALSWTAIRLYGMAAAERISTAATWLFNLALDANPIGVVVVAVAALSAGLYFLITHFRAVSRFLHGPWGTAISAAVAVLNPFIGIPMLIIGHWRALLGFFRGLWNGIKNVASTASGVAVDAFHALGSAARGVGDAFRAAFGAVARIAKTAFSGLLGVISTVLHALGSAFDLASHLPFVGGKFGDLRDAANSAADKIDRFRNSLTRTKAPIRGAGDSLKQLGGVVNGAQTGVSKLRETWQRQMGLIWGSTRSSMGKVLGSIGGQTAKAAQQGIAHITGLQRGSTVQQAQLTAHTSAHTGRQLALVTSRSQQAMQKGTANFTRLQSNATSQQNQLTSHTSSNTGRQLSLIATRTAQAAARATTNFTHLQTNTTHQMNVSSDHVTSSTGRMLSTIATRTSRMAQDAIHQMGVFSGTVHNNMQHAANATGSGGNKIIDATQKLLKSFGVGGGLASIGNIVVGKVGYAKGGIHDGYARGGLVNQPGYFAGEEAPRHKEVIIATNPAYRQRNLGFWAKAGEMLGVPGFAQGGVPPTAMHSMISRANWIDAQHFPYVWGGGHGSGFGPTGGTAGGAIGFDCSGAVSSVLGYGGYIPHPSTWTGGLSRLGAPGPGQVTLYGNAEHIYMSILGRFFGTSGANPGGGAGWYPGSPQAGFGERHLGRPGQFAGAIPMLSAPKVTGGGTYGRIVDASLKKMTDAANQYIQKKWMLSGNTSHGDVGAISPSTGNVLRDMFRALTSRGWGKVAIAAAMGNSFQESSWNPASSGGLFGFTASPVSMSDLQAAASRAGVPWQSAGLQAAFMAAHYGDLAALNAYRDVSQATSFFMNTFEKPAGWAANLPHRISAAQRAYSMGYRHGGIVDKQLAQMPPYAGSFATGGIVPGPLGEPRTIVAHGGEPVGQQGPLVSIENMYVNDSFDEQALAYRLAWMVER